MKKVSKTITSFCPACDTRIRFAERPKLSEVVICPECEGTFEVVQLSPLVLDWAAYDEDEWDDYEDDEDEFEWERRRRRGNGRFDGNRSWDWDEEDN